MKFLLSGCCFLLLFKAHAQRTVDVTKMETVNESMFMSAGGEPFVNVKFVRLVDGSPYFKDSWLKGTVVLASGKIASGGFLKLDLMDNELHYLDAKDKEMVAINPLKEISLFDTSANAVFHFVHSSSIPKAKQGWYLQLTDGKAILFKFLKKALLEQTPYGSATVEQRIQTSEQFFLLYNDAFIEIKRLKDLSTVLQNTPEFDKYLGNLEKKKGVTSDKLIAAVNFYNSVQ